MWTAQTLMLSDVHHYSDQRQHDHDGPSRTVKYPRASTVGGGAFATSQDGSRCVVAGKDVLRIIRVTDRPHSYTDGTRVSTGVGGATIEAGTNMWPASGLKMDSAPTDVVWARGAFDTKIVTSARNGEIVYWDVNRAGSKYETRIKEHKRAVNKLAISPFLPYLFASGSQDGHLRIWDLRTPPASSMKVYHPTGIRALALSPVPSSPLTICTGLQSGNIQRWDLRNRAMPLERITLAHAAAVLSMDWQLPSIAEGGLGWLLTSGMDRRVKIWDLCSPPAASSTELLHKKMGPRAFRTLHAPWPVRKACWRPRYDCEVAIVSNNDGDGDTVEVWDIRRGWIGKWTLDGVEGGVTDMSFATSHTIRLLHASGAFAQHDLREASRPLDAVPRVAMSWAAGGGLAFVAQTACAGEVPFDDVDPYMSSLGVRRKATSDPVYIPYGQTLGVQDIPLVDGAAFAHLAGVYVFAGDRVRACAMNAEAASRAGERRAAQTWLLLLTQLLDLGDPGTPTTTEPHPPSYKDREPPSSRISSTSTSTSASIASRLTHIDTHPPETSPNPLYRTQHTPPSSESSPSPRLRTIALPSPSYPHPDATTPSPTTRRASTVLPVTPRPPRPPLRRASMSTPPGAEGSPGAGGGGGYKLAHVGEGALDDSDSDSDASGEGGEGVGVGGARTPGMVRPSPLSRRADSPDGHLAGDERSTLGGGAYDSDSGSDSGSESPPSTSSSEHLSRASTSRTHVSSVGTGARSLSVHRALVKQGSHSSIRTVTVPPEEPQPPAPAMGIGMGIGTGTGPSSEGVSTRRPSPHPHSHPPALGLSNMTLTAPDAPRTLGETRAREIAEDEAALREIGWAALREAVEGFAETGDVQMCALLAMVAPVELGVAPARAVRFVEAYIELLLRLQLHTLAAHVRKYAPYAAVRDTTQVQTTVYSSCGACRTPVKVGLGAAGPLLCHKCKARPTLCVICHCPVRKLLVHCPGCGHGGHQACYRAFYLARPLTELSLHTTAASLHDSYSSADTGSGSGSTAYYSLSDGAEDGGEEEEDAELDGSTGTGRGSGREELHEYETTASSGSERRPRMRVLGHACAAGCGHWCWAANERFSGA